MSVTVRPMLAADVPAAARAGAGGMGFVPAPGREWRRWEQRIGYLLGPDPAGAFVAERRGEVIGVAQAMQRGALWVLSFLAVDPAAHGSGAGGALMRAALAYGEPSRGLIVASNHPAALRLYARAGFALRPTLRTQGRADPARLPAPTGLVRGGGERDLALTAAISAEVRGAPHTQELRYAVRRGGRLLLAEDRGFAVAQEGHGVWLLVARDDAAAAELLRRALVIGGDAEQPVRWITAGQDWAVGVVLAAGLQLTGYGALCAAASPARCSPFCRARRSRSRAFARPRVRGGTTPPRDSWPHG